MSFLLKPGFLQTAKSAADVQKLMKADLKNSAGKSGVKFVAAKNYDIGGKKISLFIVTDNQAPFETIIKTQPKALRAKGTCDVAKDNGKIKIIVKTSSGQMLADGIAKIVPDAVKDNSFTATHFGAPAGPPTGIKSKAQEMAERSHAEARQETIDPKTGNKVAPKIDWLEFKPEPAIVDQMAKMALETAEYQKFADAYEKLATRYKFNTDPDYKKVPVNIWHDLIKGMAESGYIAQNIPKASPTEPWKLVFAKKSPSGAMIREELLARAMKGMDVYIRHAATNLDKVAKAVEANGGKTWAFWSGAGAKDAALREAGGGVVLEGSVGAWFHDTFTITALTGVHDMLLWNSMSELYARKAAEYYQKFSFVGFVGAGGAAPSTVFVNIERPTLIQVLNVQKQVAVPPFDWRVVVCKKKESERSGWEGTDQPTIRVANRMEAERVANERYPAKGTPEYLKIKEGATS